MYQYNILSLTDQNIDLPPAKYWTHINIKYGNSVFSIQSMETNGGDVNIFQNLPSYLSFTSIIKLKITCFDDIFW
jgi:hypothetical protein